MIESFWNICLLNEITTRDQLLREAIRVIRTKEFFIDIKGNQGIPDTPDMIYEMMKKHVGDRELGPFPGGRDLFYKLYQTGKDLDLLEFALHTIQQDRVTGGVVVHPGITTRFIEYCERHHFRTILFTEAEKFLRGLIESKCYNHDFKITLLTENFVIARLLNTYFRGHPNVDVLQGSIYQPLPLDGKFQAILAMPNFGMKINEDQESSIRSSESVAVNHLLPLLQETGIISVTLPSRIMFQAGDIAKWRKHINEIMPVQSIHLLPDGFFRPFTSVKTYQIELGKLSPDKVSIGELRLNNSKLFMDREITIHPDPFSKLATWQIELLLNEDQDTLRSYQQADVPKVILRDVADIFRGKSVLKQDLKPGPIKVLNISNLHDGEVVLDQLETIDEAEKKISRYVILPGDLVMTCRGTVNKLAVFPKSDSVVIASANIIVIRFKSKIINHYAKMFLESPVGIAIIQSIQRGTTVMNLNPSDVAEIEIPLIPEELQRVKVETYLKEKERYVAVIQKATDRWELIKKQLYSELY